MHDTPMCPEPPNATPYPVSLNGPPNNLLPSSFVTLELNNQQSLCLMNDLQMVESIPSNSEIYAEDGGEDYSSDHNERYDSINGNITVETPCPNNLSTSDVSVY